jgi:hypothetical protein
MARKLREHAPTFIRPSLMLIARSWAMFGSRRASLATRRPVRSSLFWFATRRPVGSCAAMTSGPFHLMSSRLSVPSSAPTRFTVFVERPLSGEYGLYAHEDNSDLRGTPKDEEGFFLGQSGERIARYVRPVLGKDGKLQYTDESQTRYVAEPDPHYWEIVDEHPDLEAAKQIAEQHL